MEAERAYAVLFEHLAAEIVAAGIMLTCLRYDSVVSCSRSEDRGGGGESTDCGVGAI